MLIALKIAVTMAAVVGLSLIAERISTRLAGVLAGFPHGIAIVLYFIGLEQGADFASRAALFAIAGLGANVGLAYAYARLSGWLGTGRGRGLSTGLVPVLVAGLGSVAVFMAMAYVLRLIAPAPGLAVLLTLACIGLVRVLIRHGGRGADRPAIRPPLRLGELLARAALAAAIVVLITGMAAALGPGWAGLLAGFPVVTFPLLLIMHARHGPAPVAAIVRHYPFGIMSLLVFSLSVSWGFAALGIGWGTLAGLGAAVLYLVLASAIKARR